MPLIRPDEQATGRQQEESDDDKHQRLRHRSLTTIALTDAELDPVAGAGIGQKVLGMALTTGGALTTAASVLTRQWGLASRGCNMLVDGVGHLEAA